MNNISTFDIDMGQLSMSEMVLIVPKKGSCSKEGCKEFCMWPMNNVKEFPSRMCLCIYLRIISALITWLTTEMISVMASDWSESPHAGLWLADTPAPSRDHYRIITTHLISQHPLSPGSQPGPAPWTQTVIKWALIEIKTLETLPGGEKKLNSKWV